MDDLYDRVLEELIGSGKVTMTTLAKRMSVEESELEAVAKKLELRGRVCISRKKQSRWVMIELVTGAVDGVSPTSHGGLIRLNDARDALVGLIGLYSDEEELPEDMGRVRAAVRKSIKMTMDELVVDFREGTDAVSMEINGLRLALQERDEEIERLTSALREQNQEIDVNLDEEDGGGYEASVPNQGDYQEVLGEGRQEG